MTATVMRVRAYAPWCYVVTGKGAGRLLMEANGGRPPQWSRSMHGYATSDKVAIKVMTLADHERIRVRFEDFRNLPLVDMSPPLEKSDRQNPDLLEQLDLGLEPDPGDDLEPDRGDG